MAQLGERRVRNAEVEGSIPFGSTNKKSRTQIARSGFFIVSDKPPEQERTVFLKQSARGENARRKYQAQRAVRGAAEYEVFIGKFFGF